MALDTSMYYKTPYQAGQLPQVTPPNPMDALIQQQNYQQQMQTNRYNNMLNALKMQQAQQQMSEQQAITGGLMSQFAPTTFTPGTPAQPARNVPMEGSTTGMQDFQPATPATPDQPLYTPQELPAYQGKASMYQAAISMKLQANDYYGAQQVLNAAKRDPLVGRNPKVQQFNIMGTGQSGEGNITIDRTTGMQMQHKVDPKTGLDTVTPLRTETALDQEIQKIASSSEGQNMSDADIRKQASENVKAAGVSKETLDQKAFNANLHTVQQDPRFKNASKEVQQDEATQRTIKQMKVEVPAQAGVARLQGVIGVGKGQWAQFTPEEKQVIFANAETQGIFPKPMAGGGMSGAGMGMNQAQLKEYADYLNKKGVTGMDLAVNGAKYKTDVRAAGTVQTQYDQTKQSAVQAKNNAKVALDEIDKLYLSSGSKDWNQFINWVRDHASSEQVKRAKLALSTFAREYQRVVTGAARSAAELSMGAQEFSDKMFSLDYSRDAIRGLIEVGIKDMDGSIEAYRTTTNDIYSRIGKSPIQPPPTPTTPTPTVTPGKKLSQQEINDRVSKY
jgi:hypothetical protein